LPGLIDAGASPDEQVGVEHSDGGFGKSRRHGRPGGKVGGLCGLGGTSCGGITLVWPPAPPFPSAAPPPSVQALGSSIPPWKILPVRSLAMVAIEANSRLGQGIEVGVCA
jgi:hypothetical protein